MNGVWMHVSLEANIDNTKYLLDGDSRLLKLTVYHSTKTLTSTEFITLLEPAY